MSLLLDEAKAFHVRGELAEAGARYAAHWAEHPEDIDNAFLFIQYLAAIGKYEDALGMATTALEAMPASASLYSIKGHIHLRRDELLEAESCLIRACLLQQEQVKHGAAPLVEPWLYLAQLAIKQAKWDKAVELHRHCLAIDATNATALYGMAMLDLRRGNWRKGWTGYDARWRTTAFLAENRRFMPGQPWMGEDLAGKTVLVQAEQGQGDLIQFIRYLPHLAQTGARIFLEVGRAELAPLIEPQMARFGIERLVFVGDIYPETAYHTALMSLPARLKLWAPVWDGPYFAATAPEPRGTKPRIGYAWAGNPKFQNDKARSFLENPFTDWLADDRYEWVDCQVGRGGTFEPRDWLDTANRLASLDRLISVDTGIAHLAGAMGVPTDLLTAFCPDWRWGTDQSITPWYPSFTIWRQPRIWDWAPVLDAVRANLSRMCPIDTVTPRE